MNAWWRWTDRALALLLAASLGMALWTLTSTNAQAAESVTESRPVAGVRAVVIAGHFELLARQAPTTTLTVQAEPQWLPLIETTVDDRGTLSLRWKPDARPPAQARVRFELTTPQLERLASSGSGQAELRGFGGAALTVSLAGKSNLRLDDVSPPRLDLHLSGTSEVRASGRTPQLNVAIAGAGDLQADALETDVAKISIAGSGQAAVHAVRELTVSIAGSGDVVYRGTPALRQSISGFGRVRVREAR